MDARRQVPVRQHRGEQVCTWPPQSAARNARRRGKQTVADPGNPGPRRPDPPTSEVGISAADLGIGMFLKL